MMSDTESRNTLGMNQESNNRGRSPFSLHHTWPEVRRSRGAPERIGGNSQETAVLRLERFPGGLKRDPHRYPSTG